MRPLRGQACETCETRFLLCPWHPQIGGTRAARCLHASNESEKHKSRHDESMVQSLCRRQNAAAAAVSACQLLMNTVREKKIVCMAVLIRTHGTASTTKSWPPCDEMASSPSPSERCHKEQCVQRRRMRRSGDVVLDRRRRGRAWLVVISLRKSIRVSSWSSQ